MNDVCIEPVKSETRPWIAGITAPPTIAITTIAPAVSVNRLSSTVSNV